MADDLKEVYAYMPNNDSFIANLAWTKFGGKGDDNKDHGIFKESSGLVEDEEAAKSQFHSPSSSPLQGQEPLSFAAWSCACKPSPLAPTA